MASVCFVSSNFTPYHLLLHLDRNLRSSLGLQDGVIGSICPCTRTRRLSFTPEQIPPQIFFIISFFSAREALCLSGAPGKMFLVSQYCWILWITRTHIDKTLHCIAVPKLKNPSFSSYQLYFRVPNSSCRQYCNICGVGSAEFSESH